MWIQYSNCHFQVAWKCFFWSSEDVQFVKHFRYMHCASHVFAFLCALMFMLKIQCINVTVHWIFISKGRSWSKERADSSMDFCGPDVYFLASADTLWNTSNRFFLCCFSPGQPWKWYYFLFRCNYSMDVMYHCCQQLLCITLLLLHQMCSISIHRSTLYFHSPFFPCRGVVIFAGVGSFAMVKQHVDRNRYEIMKSKERMQVANATTDNAAVKWSSTDNVCLKTLQQLPETFNSKGVTNSTETFWMLRNEHTFAVTQMSHMA